MAVSYSDVVPRLLNIYFNGTLQGESLSQGGVAGALYDPDSGFGPFKYGSIGYTHVPEESKYRSMDIMDYRMYRRQLRLVSLFLQVCLSLVICVERTFN